MTTASGSGNSLDKFNKTLEDTNQHVEKIGNFFSGGTEFSKDIASSVNALGENFTEIKKIVDSFKSQGTNLKGALSKKFASFAERLSGITTSFEKSFSENFSMMGEGIKGKLGELKDSFMNNPLFSAFSSAFATEIEVLKSIKNATASLFGLAQKFMIPFFVAGLKFLMKLGTKLFKFLAAEPKKKSAFTSKDSANTVEGLGADRDGSDVYMMPEKKESEGIFASLRKRFSGVFKWIKDAAETMAIHALLFFDKVKKAFTILRKGFKTGLRIFGRIFAIGTLLFAAFDGIKEGIKIYEDTGSLTQAILGSIEGFFVSMGEMAMNLLDTVFDLVGNLFVMIGDALGFDTEGLKGVLEAFNVAEYLKRSMTWLMDNGLGQFINSVMDFIIDLSDIIMNPLDSIRDFFFGDDEDDDDSEKTLKKQEARNKRKPRETFQLEDGEEMPTLDVTSIMAEAKAQAAQQMQRAEEIEDKKVAADVAASMGTAGNQVAVQQNSTSNQSVSHNYGAPKVSLPADTATE